MRTRVSIVLLSLLMTLAVLNVAGPSSLAQDVTEETTVEVTSVGPNRLIYSLSPDEQPQEAEEFVIRGNGFVEPAKVVFFRELEDGTIYTITPSSGKIFFVSPTLLRIVAPRELWVNDENNFLDGLWGVRVTNPNGHSASIKDGLRVDTTFIEDIEEQREQRDRPTGATCVIATAAYGSEMAPEVQYLREFRDETVLSTFAGSSFMDAFNSFYYSWSPGVADSIREDDQARAFTRGMIVPLLGVLSVSSSVYVLLSFIPELGVTLTGFVASSMLGAIYLALPMFALLRLMSRSMRRVIIRKGMVLLLVSSATGFTITSLGVYSLSSYLAMFGSATLVLSSMFAAALIVSSLILVLAGPTHLRINSMWHVITRS